MGLKSCESAYKRKSKASKTAAKRELKRSRVRSLKSDLLKRMSKKARRNLSPFVAGGARSSKRGQIQAQKPRKKVFSKG